MPVWPKTGWHISFVSKSAKTRASKFSHLSRSVSWRTDVRSRRIATLHRSTEIMYEIHARTPVKSLSYNFINIKLPGQITSKICRVAFGVAVLGKGSNSLQGWQSWARVAILGKAGNSVQGWRFWPTYDRCRSGRPKFTICSFFSKHRSNSSGSAMRLLGILHWLTLVLTVGELLRQGVVTASPLMRQRHVNDGGGTADVIVVMTLELELARNGGSNGGNGTSMLSPVPTGVRRDDARRPEARVAAAVSADGGAERPIILPSPSPSSPADLNATSTTGELQPANRRQLHRRRSLRARRHYVGSNGGTSAHCRQVCDRCKDLTSLQYSALCPGECERGTGHNYELCQHLLLG